MSDQPAYWQPCRTPSCREDDPAKVRWSDPQYILAAESVRTEEGKVGARTMYQETAMMDCGSCDTHARVETGRTLPSIPQD